MKDLMSLENFTKDQVLQVMRVAEELKQKPENFRETLKNKMIGLVFQKPSNRTRVSFEVGIRRMGGQAIYLGPEEINLGVRESVHDVAQTLSRMLDGVVARTYRHEDILLLGQYSQKPVINGLSDLYHPCQALTDAFTILEHLKRDQDITIAYVGDGNNVCHSLMYVFGLLGFHFRMATPPGYEPLSDVVDKAQAMFDASHAEMLLTHDPYVAVKDADIVYTDVWVSMGQENERHTRLNDFSQYQINQDLLTVAHKDYRFMHCLPAHRGQEVVEEIMDGSHSIVFDQAENRIYAQQAVLQILFN